jgi:O-antigen ligase
MERAMARGSLKDFDFNRSTRISHRGTEVFHSGDMLLGLALALTTVDLSLEVAGLHVGLGDVAFIPIALYVFLSPARNTLSVGYVAVASCYLLWSVCSLAWSRVPGQAVGPLLQYIEFFAIVPLAFSSARNVRGIVVVLRFYVTCAAVLAAAVIVYAVATGTYSYVYFLNYQKNYLGAILGNAIPLILGLLAISRRRGWLVVAALLTTSGLLLSSSRGSMLGAVIGVAVFLVLIHRLRYGFALGALGLVVYVVYSTWIAPNANDTLTNFGADSSAGSRFFIWSDALRAASEAPVVGHGVGSYLIRIPSIGFEQADPSNVFLLNLVEVGAVGLVLFSILLLSVAARVISNSLRLPRGDRAFVLSAAAAGAFAAHLTHIQLDVSWVRGTGTFAFAMVGVIYAITKLSRDVIE